LQKVEGSNISRYIACVASVPVRRGRNSVFAKEFFAFRQGEIGAGAKRWKEGDKGGEGRESLPAKPFDFEKRLLVFTVEFIY